MPQHRSPKLAPKTEQLKRIVISERSEGPHAPNLNPERRFLPPEANPCTQFLYRFPPKLPPTKLRPKASMG
jgi:hypothetical protein